MIRSISIHLIRLAQVTLAVAILHFANQLRADRPGSTEPEPGIRDRSPNLYALSNARLVTGPGKRIPKGVLVIRNGLIAAVGAEVDIPEDAHVLDMSGKTVYPGLIEPYSEVNLQPGSSSTAHWSVHVRPELSVVTDLKGLSPSNKELREVGFALRLVAPKAGILKGTSVVVTTSEQQGPDSVVAEDLAQHLRLTRPAGASRQQYPNSAMGAVALARQTFYDAQWYARAWRAHRSGRGDVARPETNDALAALSDALQRDALFVFDAPDEQYALRAHQFAIEFGLNRVALRGSGREFQRLSAIARMKVPFILPVHFPKPPNVATSEAARDASLAELMHWHLAPENPARLHAADVRFAFTAFRLEEVAGFRQKVAQAVERGLDADEALAACTLRPAEILGIEDRAGTIEVGKAAHLMIVDGDWLDKQTRVFETWVDGRRFQHIQPSHEGLVGTWQLSLESVEADRATLFLQLESKQDKLSGKASTTMLAGGETKSTADPEEPNAPAPGQQEPATETPLSQIRGSFGRLTASFSAEIWSATGTVRLTGTTFAGDHDSPGLIGELVDQTGRRVAFRGSRLQDAEPNSESNSEESQGRADEGTSASLTKIEVNYPLGAYGVTEPNREPVDVVFRNATIWTCGPEGVIENGSIYLRDGRIVAVGRDLDVPRQVRSINVRGKHITPGLIDCHSHMATDGGVNEPTQAITAEVRIGDFIDSTDISIYRQLAGGVTLSNILHGSANPIGGQNQVIKLRWGQLPETMKFREAPQGIKFALGENVKQSNWGDDFTTRYPQSRLGVEQIMRDAFLAARNYEQKWNTWRTHGTGIPPRKDLELDAILEILRGQRWIHCHSYRQDEILALIRTLDEFGITIGTFQHILEGYKVAPEMAKHGAMGSAFSDWWAYKFEVYDAIPYNGALMHEAGVVVSFNSDDAELARHLNHEAAKATKYGGVPAIEALKFVTLNPAKQLRIDPYVGSLEAGKHADLVVWSGHPLQITSRCEQTWIDGARYFDITEEQNIRQTHARLRQQLVQRILDSGESMKKPGDHQQLLRDLFPRYDEFCGHGHTHHH